MNRLQRTDTTKRSGDEQMPVNATVRMRDTSALSIDAEEVLDWDFSIENTPATPSGTLTVSLDPVGHDAPISLGDLSDE